jgi:hypothetical protein
VRIDEVDLPFAGEALAWVGLQRLFVSHSNFNSDDTHQIFASDLVVLTATLRGRSLLGSKTWMRANGEVAAGRLTIEISILEGAPPDMPRDSPRV